MMLTNQSINFVGSVAPFLGQKSSGRGYKKSWHLLHNSGQDCDEFTYVGTIPNPVQFSFFIYSIYNVLIRICSVWWLDPL